MGTSSPEPEKRQKEEQEMKTGMRMNSRMRDFLKYLATTLCSAIVTYLAASCTAGLVIGHNQRQHQENNISIRAGSAHAASPSDECAPACKFNPVSPKGASRFLPDTSRQAVGAEASLWGRSVWKAARGAPVTEATPRDVCVLCVLIAQGGRFTWWPEPHSPRSRPASRTR